MGGRVIYFDNSCDYEKERDYKDQNRVSHFDFCFCIFRYVL